MILSHSTHPQKVLMILLSHMKEKKPEEIILSEPATQARLLWQNPDGSGLNKLYYGDNFPILASLYHNVDIKGKVDLIYIDPPFATNQIFKSRGQKNAYSDLLVGAHFIEFMRQRLIFLRDLLSDKGSIYVHLDGNMAFHIKVIMDEIFGVQHFRNFITRRKCNPKNYTRKTYGNVSDYILYYTKSDSYIWNRAYEVWTPERSAKEYQYAEPETGRLYKKVPIHAPGERNGQTGKPWRGMMPPPGKHWQYTPERLDEMDAKGEIYWSSNGNPRRKVYLDESSGIPVQDIWLDMRDAHNQNIKITGYPTEKPPELLARIIEASSNPGSLVLDCFSGSGTTLAVASELDRQWIGIDRSPEAIRTTLHRFKSGLQPMGDYVNQRKKYDIALEQQHLPFADTKDDVDFALYAIEPYQNDLETVIKEWCEQ